MNELDRKVKTLTKEKNNIETELRTLVAEFQREGDENFHNKQYLDKTRENGDLQT